jgi:hypothetical protein
MSDNQVNVQFEGAAVRIGSRDMIMPSLSVGQARKFWPQILRLNSEGVTIEEVLSTMPSKFGDMVQIIHAALSRNYPDLTLTELENEISINQLRQLMMIVSGQSGMDSKGEKIPDATGPSIH